MRRLSNFALAAFACWLLAACSPIKVRHDYDQDVNFTEYQTYKWVEQDTQAEGDAKSAKMRNDLLDKRIRSAVDKQLEGKGLKLVAEQPDLLVTYFTGVDEKIRVMDRGYRYGAYYGSGYSYYGLGTPAVDVYQYKVGNLIIDLIDSKTNKLVWRGSAEAVVDETASSREREERIQEAVSKILSDYPPHLDS